MSGTPGSRLIGIQFRPQLWTSPSAPAYSGTSGLRFTRPSTTEYTTHEILCIICAEKVMEHLTDAEAARSYDEYREFTDAIRASGHLIDCNRLAATGYRNDTAGAQWPGVDGRWAIHRDPRAFRRVLPHRGP